ncbi:sugar phosphate isomerase/epimerase [Roseovarius pacificus]|uniref:sugar phosphate isomerase/epimerase family protein n=1 Tax=Roseovarius pacificus TaxID=337701 RepID=UPI002A18ABC5|nr:sugar phosphate isomerase/epimerase [Roseovarius pacificus]
MKTSPIRTYSRREALALMGGTIAAASLARFGVAQDAPAVTPKMALQLYTLRDPAKKDLAGTLQKVKEMGWEYVQWSGMPDLPAAKIREALDTAGLKAISCHCGVEPFETDFDNYVAFWKTVGVKFVGPGGMMGDCKDSLEAWIRGAKRLDAVGAKLREEGLQLMYHNHAGEFETFPGDDRAKEYILADETSPENLAMELDLAWIYVGGVDPSECIRRFKGRVPHVHAKDVVMRGSEKPRPMFTPLGQGELDWDEIFKAGAEAGIEWYTYEQDSGRGDPFEYTAESYDFLKKRIG